MSVSLKVVLKSEPYSDGTHAVWLQCIVKEDGPKQWKRRTLCRVKESQFDKATSRIKNHPNKTLLNAQINEIFSEAQQRLIDLQRAKRRIDPEFILGSGEVITTERSDIGMLLAQGKAYADRCKQKGQVHTAEKYHGHLTRLAEYLGKTKDGQQRDVHMDDVDEEWIMKWVVWLKKNGTKSVNTLHRRMAFMKTLYNYCRKRGFTKADPMALLEFKEQRVRKPKLTLEQISQLEAVELDGLVNDARNTFLMQFYAYGTRISDALTWKKTDIRKEGEAMYLHYTSMKTGDLIDVRLNDNAKAIVAYYMDTVPGPFLLPWMQKYKDLPHLSTDENKARLIAKVESQTFMVNLRLKKVAEKLKWENLNLTTHIARHSFAALADEHIPDKRKISAALGHSKFSTTEIYLNELRQNDVNDAMDGLWEKR